MTTINTATLSLLSAGFKADVKAGAAKDKAYDALFADGVRSANLLKSNDDFCADVFEAIQAAIIAAVFSKPEAALLAMDAKEAKAKGVGAARTALTRVLSKYVGNVRQALDARDPEKQKEKAKKSSGDAGEIASEVESTQPKTEVAGIQPGADLASYKEALNLMIVATRCHTDKAIQANADAFCEVFSEMLKALKA